MSDYEPIEFTYDSAKKPILDMLPAIIETNPEFAKFVFNCSKPHVREIERLLGLSEIDGILYFRMPSKFQSQVHIDMNLASGRVRTCAVNLPLTPCKNVVMRWYDKIEGAQEASILGAHLTSFPTLEFDQVIQRAECELAKPVLAQIHPWHNVDNITENQDVECFISLRFRRDLTDEQVKQLLKKNH